MSRIQSDAEREVKLTPSVETSEMTNASIQSNNSISSSTADREKDRPTEERSSVKSLVNKNDLIEQKVRSARTNIFDSKKKSFSAACERLYSSYKDCVNMEEGDIQLVENVETFVKNHVYEVFNTTANHVPHLNQNISETIKFDFKTAIPDVDKILNDLGNNFWEQISFMIKTNREYYKCLTQIVDTRQFQNLRDVRLYVSSELKNRDLLGYVETDLTPAFKDHLEKFTNILNTELNEELPKLKFLSYRTKINALRNELEEVKRNTKIAQFNIKLLQKEKKDLTNILKGYNTENLHKEPLESRLKSEKEKSVELQAMVSSILENKTPFCICQIDGSSHSVCKSKTSD